MIERSAFGGLTVVVAELELFAVLGSLVVLVTDAVFVSAPVPVAVTLIVIVADLPEASVPRLQVTVVVPVQPVEAERSVSPLGSGSVTITAAAGLGPLFFTVSV